MIIHHTEVNDPLKGQNIGKKLVNTAVEYARKQQLKILSLCPLVNTFMKRHKAFFADVLKEN
jgi:predicted GNAT family acetyltransferase